MKKDTKKINDNDQIESSQNFYEDASTAFYEIERAKNSKLLEQYKEIMVCIKTKINHTNSIYNIIKDYPRSDLIKRELTEFLYLQIRLICELIALACLVAHGEEVDNIARKLKGEFHAGKIIKRLGQISSNFFPVPFKESVFNQQISGLHTFKGSFLTKADLMDVYNKKCADIVHIGSLKNFSKEIDLMKHNFEDAIEHFKKIHNLLKNHIIEIKDSTRVLVCYFGSADEDINVFYGYMSAAKNKKQ